MSILVKPGVIWGIGPGVELATPLSPAGARILEALKKVAAFIDFDITITSANDGKHSGPQDPHHRAAAFDLRTKTLQEPQKALLLRLLREELYGNPRRFYAFLEDTGGPNEHIHVQERLGTTYTIYDLLTNR